MGGLKNSLKIFHKHANLKYKNVEVEIIDDPSVKVMADIDYKVLCKANKTGIDFEF